MARRKSIPSAAVASVALSVAISGVGVPAHTSKYRHAWAVDGDTIQLRNGKYVRLLGDDTREVSQLLFGPSVRAAQPVKVRSNSGGFIGARQSSI